MFCMSIQLCCRPGRPYSARVHNCVAFPTDLFDSDSIKGSVIAAPDGELLKLGDTYHVDDAKTPSPVSQLASDMPQDGATAADVIDSISDANKIVIPAGNFVFVLCFLKKFSVFVLVCFCLQINFAYMCTYKSLGELAVF